LSFSNQFNFAVTGAFVCRIIMSVITDSVLFINRLTSERWRCKSIVSHSALTVNTVTYLCANCRILYTENNSFSTNVAGIGSCLSKFNSDAQRALPNKSHWEQSTDCKSTYFIWLIHISGLCYLIAESLKPLWSLFVPIYGQKHNCSDQKNKNTESMYIFFDRKINCQKIRNCHKQKTKFGQRLPVTVLSWEQGSRNNLKGICRTIWIWQ